MNSSPRLSRILAAALLSAVAVFAAAAPAHAHDELLISVPAADATLDTLPGEISLTFSGTVSVEPGATEVEVTDADGTTVSAGDPLVDGTIVTQALDGDASGVLTVLWKVVSSDGHPISGEYSFTVEPAPAPAPTPTTPTEPTDEPTAAPGDEPAEDAVATPISAPVPDDADAPRWPWIVGGVLVIGVGGVVVYLLLSRARRERELGSGSER